MENYITFINLMIKLNSISIFSVYAYTYMLAYNHHHRPLGIYFWAENLSILVLLFMELELSLLAIY